MQTFPPQDPLERRQPTQLKLLDGPLGAAHDGGRLGQRQRENVAQQKNFPLDQTWQLKELNGKPISSDLDVSLKIDGALHASGYSGCNSWSAVIYPVKDQHLAMGPPALTKKQCDKDTMAIEFDFLSVLHSGPTWDLVNGELVIKGPRGTLRLARSL